MAAWILVLLFTFNLYWQVHSKDKIEITAVLYPGSSDYGYSVKLGKAFSSDEVEFEFSKSNLVRSNERSDEFEVEDYTKLRKEGQYSLFASWKDENSLPNKLEFKLTVRYGNYHYYDIDYYVCTYISINTWSECTLKKHDRSACKSDEDCGIVNVCRINDHMDNYCMRSPLRFD